MRKYQKVAALASNSLPAGVSIEAVFELLLDHYLDRNDPTRRVERREARRTRSRKGNGNGGNDLTNPVETGSSMDANAAAMTVLPAEASSPDAAGAPKEAGTAVEASKHAGPDARAAASKPAGADVPLKRSVSAERRVPSEVRDRVHVRDGGRCTFTSPNGQRCGEMRRLQVDHVVPWSLGGTHDPANLRLLCTAHNQLQADRLFGTEHMARFRRHE